MRKYLSYFFLLCLIIALISASHLSYISQDIITNFALTILPSLAPAMLFDYLFIHSDGLSYLYQLLIKKSHNPHAIYRHLLVVLGLISGTPTLASYVEDSLNKGYLSKEEGEIIISCFMIPSFPFLLSIIFPLLKHQYVWILLLIIYGPSSIIYFLKTRKFKTPTSIDFKPSSGNYLKEAILATAFTMILLLGTMLVFSFPQLFINQIDNELVRYTFQGLFEFTAIKELALLNSKESFFLLMMILSFSSFSLFTQTAILAPSLSLKEVIKKRLLLGGVNMIILTLIFIF